MNFRMKRQYEAFEKEMKAVDAIQKEIKLDPVFIFKIGKIYARLNRLKEAGQLLEILKTRIGDVLAVSGINRSNQSDQESFHLLNGEIALARRQYEEAIGSFGMAASLGDNQLEDSLAFAYSKSGNLEKSIEKYEEFLKTDVLGYEGQELWILAIINSAGSMSRRANRPKRQNTTSAFSRSGKTPIPPFPKSRMPGNGWRI